MKNLVYLTITLVFICFSTNIHSSVNVNGPDQMVNGEWKMYTGNPGDVVESNDGSVLLISETFGGGLTGAIVVPGNGEFWAYGEGLGTATIFDYGNGPDKEVEVIPDYLPESVTLNVATEHTCADCLDDWLEQNSGGQGWVEFSNSNNGPWDSFFQITNSTYYVKGITAGSAPVSIYDELGIPITNETVIVDAPTPIEILYFEIRCDNGIPKLSWETQSEVNNDHFKIERKYDSYEFEEIIQITGKGKQHLGATYTYSDFSLTEVGVYYYRLSQVDFNGISKIVGVKSINLKNGARDIDFFPNPIKSGEVLKIDTHTDEVKKMSVFNSLGYLVFNQELSESEIQFDTEKLIPGIYFIEISEKEKIISKSKLIVE